MYTLALTYTHIQRERRRQGIRDYCPDMGGLLFRRRDGVREGERERKRRKK